jgi:hypothetical protein
MPTKDEVFAALIYVISFLFYRSWDLLKKDRHNLWIITEGNT